MCAQQWLEHSLQLELASEDPRFDGTERDACRPGDLLVTQPLILTKQDRFALLRI